MSRDDLQQGADSFRLHDVTDDPAMLSVAFDLVVEGYRGLSSSVIDPAEVRENVCEDVFHRRGRARTLLLTGNIPQSSGLEPLGTIRLNMASSLDAYCDTYPLEAMSLMSPERGWTSFSFEGFDINQSVEGGRTAVSSICRKRFVGETRLASLVLDSMFRMGFQYAQQRYRKSQYWGILPVNVVGKIEAMGLHVKRAPDVLLDRERNAELFSKYDRYWLESDPGFYRVIVPSAGNIETEYRSGGWDKC